MKIRSKIFLMLGLDMYFYVFIQKIKFNIRNVIEIEQWFASNSDNENE